MCAFKCVEKERIDQMLCLIFALGFSAHGCSEIVHCTTGRSQLSLVTINVLAVELGHLGRHLFTLPCVATAKTIANVRASHTGTTTSTLSVISLPRPFLLRSLVLSLGGG